MSKIAEKKVKELGYNKDIFNRAEYTANDVFNACVECYYQAMQDFMEKAKEFFKSELYVSVSDQICSMNEFKTKKDFVNYFKNYIENEEM